MTISVCEPIDQNYIVVGMHEQGHCTSNTHHGRRKRSGIGRTTFSLSNNKRIPCKLFCMHGMAVFNLVIYRGDSPQGTLAMIDIVRSHLIHGHYGG